MKKLALFVLCGWITAVWTYPVQGLQFFGPEPEHTPSVFAYGFRGLGIGTLLGASAGYLIARDDDWNRDSWKDFGISAGVGALAGTVGGLAVGLYDLNSKRPGAGSIVLRDTLYGTLLGSLLGALGGGIAVISSDDWEDMALGSSIGALVGSGIGVAMGIIEGPRIMDMYYGAHSGDTNLAAAPSWSFGFNTLRGRDRRCLYVPVVTRRF